MGALRRATIRSAPIVEGEIKSSPSSACSSAWPRTSTAWSICPTCPGTKPGDEAVEPTTRRARSVKAKVLDVDVEKERISLGIKQLGERSDREGRSGGAVKKGEVVTVTVTEVNDGGIEVQLDGRRARPSSAAPIWRATATTSARTFRQVGDKVDALVTSVDKASRKVVAVDQGARNRRREGSRGAIRLVRLRRLAGRHPRRGAEKARRQEGRRGVVLSSLIQTKRRVAIRAFLFLPPLLSNC